ncbi:hypothetical protein RHAL1_02369 [Beijerinckiaceae bacterium RH AL1]|nr:hypothetical protein RHCH11_RHCH11_02323 [Beijerinckiaceae bacterium RH CH11]VVB46674.1 hypothetical protein RHAL8_02319 [Beijerinckiaceae bacterium RH AL8]VVC55451.1 hypothetical protein RHAL1_02369 [Beijerinckiaceae bacterium RH AL1]
MLRLSDLTTLPDDPIPLPTNNRSHPLAEQFRRFIQAESFPCVGAKSALSKGQLTIIVAKDIGSAADDLRIFTAMLGFIATYRRNPKLFQSFAVVFDDAAHGSEEEFERHLWARVQSLCDNDARLGHPWDNRVASDADNPHFSLSVAGEAFFVVGLHPQASRPARRFRSSALVFNLHDQFERLRADGRYEKLRATILERDEALAGSINPMLMRHGELSEARQYSGRLVDDDWRCPFHASHSASAPRG